MSETALIGNEPIVYSSRFWTIKNK